MFLINLIKNKYYYIIKILILILFIKLILYKKIKYENLIMKNYLRNNKKRLIESPKNLNHPLILKEKSDILKYISKSVGKEVTNINSIYLQKKLGFGNQVMVVSKGIFYCEILGCKRIILDKNTYWFFKKDIFYRKFRMLIKSDDKKNYNNTGIIIDNTFNLFYYTNNIKPEFRTNIIRNEIIKNFPKVNINPNDLYIYIRSGDIFRIAHPSYSQPPYCFYENILENFKFNKINLISEDKNNPVINKIIKNFPYVNYSKKSFKYDISYLSNSYNIVGATSTFLYCAIRLNKNLKNIWEFDLQRNLTGINENTHIEKAVEFSFNFYSYKKLNKKIKIYKMITTDKYKKVMLFWKNSEEQKNLMLNHKCNNNFTIFFLK